MKKFFSIFLAMIIAASALTVFASMNENDYANDVSEAVEITIEGGILTTENIFHCSSRVFRREQPQVAPKSDFLFGAQYSVVREMYVFTPDVLQWPSVIGREFDSALKRLFFIQFGEEYRLAYENSTTIGQTHRFGDFELEVIAAISYAGHKATWPVFPDVLELDTEEAADMLAASDWEGLGIPIITAQNIETHVFVALSGFDQEDGSISGTMLDVRSYDRFFGSEHHLRGILLHTDPENGRKYFIIRLNNQVPVGEEADISFTIYRLLANSVWSETRANINLARLTRTHQAAFEVNENRLPHSAFSMLTSRELQRYMGINFDLFSENFETMALNELEIRIAGGLYLTNVSLEGRVLRVQKTQDFTRHTIDGVSSAALADVRHTQEELDAIFFEWSQALEEWSESGREMDDFNAERFLARLDAHNNRHPKELFQVDLSTWEAGATRVTETAFLLERNIINHLDFIVSTQTYEVNVLVDFEVSALQVPVMDLGMRTSTGTHRVLVYDRYFVISGIEVSMLDITFRVHDAERIWEILAESPHIAGTFGLFELELVTYDGGTSLVRSMHGALQMPFVLGGDFPEYATFGMAVGLINPANITAIIINGTRISLR